MDMANTYVKNNKLKDVENLSRGVNVRLWNESESVVDHATDLLNAELWNIVPEVLAYDM